MDPKELINYLGLGTGGGFLFWIAWKFVFRTAAEQTTLGTIATNFDAMSRSLNEQLEKQIARIDDLEVEVKTLRKENRILRDENAQLREENRKLKYEV